MFSASESEPKIKTDHLQPDEGEKKSIYNNSKG